MNTALDTSALLPAVAAPPKEMLSWTIGEDGRWHFRINFSSLSIIQECAKKSHFMLQRHLRSSLESPATLFGSAIHKALEVFYRGKRTERIIPASYKEIMSMIGAGRWEPDWEEHLVFRAAHAFVTKAAPLSGLPDDNKRSVHTGAWILSHYFTSYLTDEFVVLEDAQGPIVERAFTFTVRDDELFKIDLFGTIDAVLKSDVTGVVLGVDHKTASSLYQFYDMINPNMQYSGYVWGINKALGIETESFMVNALEVKPMPKTSRGSPPNFARQITTRTKEHFDELLDALTLACMVFKANSIADTWPMSAPSSCMKYSGCEFREVCGAPKQLRENIINARFKER